MLVFAASFTALKAQLKIGVKGGVNYANLTGSDVSGNKGKAGFHAGVLVNLPLTGTVSVQPEAVFSTQGGKSTESGMPDINVNLNYINVPVLAKLTTASNFIIETGPQFGYLISAKTKQGGDKEDVKDVFKSTDFSWVFGVGYMVANTIGVDVRYHLGLTSIAKEAKAKNSVFQAGIFILLGGKPKQ